MPSAGPVGGGGDDDDDDEGEGEGEGAWEGITDADTDGVVMKKQKKKQEKKKQGDKITHKTLPSRPGAGRKKEKLVAMERERFARNLAEMSGAASASVSTVAYGVAMADDGGGGGGAGGGGMVVDDDDDDDRGVMKDGSGSASASADRWAAIREFICQTMERRPEVGRKT